MVFAGNSFIYPGRDDAMFCFKIGEKKDKERIRTGFQKLSEQSVYTRFFTHLKELSDDYLDEITNIDPKKNMTWGAFDLAHPDNIGVAVGRYTRDQTDLSKAELALTVLDEYQNQGIGTILHAVLYYIASITEVRHFTGIMLATNWKLLNRFVSLGTTTSRCGMEYEIKQPIFKDFDKLPNTEYAVRFKKILYYLKENNLCI